MKTVPTMHLYLIMTGELFWEVPACLLYPACSTGRKEGAGSSGRTSAHSGLYLVYPDSLSAPGRSCDTGDHCCVGGISGSGADFLKRIFEENILRGPAAVWAAFWQRELPRQWPGTLSPMNGFNMQEAENLILYGADEGLKVSGLLVCGVLISALGSSDGCGPLALRHRYGR